jgi:hypothetical protein
MKKILILFFVAVTGIASAQEFGEGTKVLSAGIGFGGAYGFSSYSSQSPALSLQYEHGIWPVGGPGVISLGGYAGIKSFRSEHSLGQYYYKQKWNYVVLGLRSAYHYTGHEVDNLDIYGGAMLSYNILTYSYSDNDPGPDATFRGNYGSAVGLTLYVGGRYYLAPNVAAFMELGYGVSYLTLGAAFRFE